MEPCASPLGDTIARLRSAALGAAARGWLPARLHALIAAAFARIFDQFEQLLLLWQAGALPTAPTLTPKALTPPAFPPMARTPVAHTAAPDPHPIAAHPARARAIVRAPRPHRTPAIRHPRSWYPMPPARTIPRTCPSASSARPPSARAPPKTAACARSIHTAILLRRNNKMPLPTRNPFHRLPSRSPPPQGPHDPKPHLRHL